MAQSGEKQINQLIDNWTNLKKTFYETPPPLPVSEVAKYISPDELKDVPRPAQRSKEAKQEDLLIAAVSARLNLEVVESVIRNLDVSFDALIIAMVGLPHHRIGRLGLTRLQLHVDPNPESLETWSSYRTNNPKPLQLTSQQRLALLEKLAKSRSPNCKKWAASKLAELKTQGFGHILPETSSITLHLGY